MGAEFFYRHDSVCNIDEKSNVQKMHITNSG